MSEMALRGMIEARAILVDLNIKVRNSKHKANRADLLGGLLRRQNLASLTRALHITAAYSWPRCSG